MISSSLQKLVRSLSLKKFRDSEGLFVAEGAKLISDLACGGLECVFLFSTNKSACFFENAKFIDITERELQKISNQKTPQNALAVFKIPKYQIDFEKIPNELSLALDDVQDPGNVGTIIRLADWFGIANIYCSAGCADTFMPKTVQATMGALSRVKIHRVDLHEFLWANNEKTAIYGASLRGANIYQTELTNNGIIVMGNEGKGISDSIKTLVTNEITIPSFPENRSASESLNVAAATAIVCGEFRRRRISAAR
ncbi:MAG: RNA methyltransferase [Prevotellaceae bacterium]|jgi:TrmH family RNA methyltransferase|nr:RNA methyltransferase [Prevotellaceae bacterium]